MLGDYDLYRKERPGNSNLTTDQIEALSEEERRRKKVGGGVILAVKKSLASKPINVSIKSESAYCQIPQASKPPTIIGCVYRPPENYLETCGLINKEIREVKSKFKKSLIWVGGDFNLPDINWESYSTHSNKYLKEINQNFLDTFNDTGLRQTVDAPTRGENILDIFLTNCPDLIKSSAISAGVGDHNAVHITSTLHLTRRKPIKRTIRLWRKANVDGIKRDVRNFAALFLNNHSTTHCVDLMWESIKDNLLQILDRYVPTKSSTSRIHQPWITTETKRLLRRKQRWFRRAKSKYSSNARSTYLEIKKLAQRTCRKP